MVFINERLRDNAKAAGIPSRFVFRPAEVAASLKDHIRGQDKMIDHLQEQLNVIHAGLHDERRPLLSALFIGATGTGKTETVRQIAKTIHGRTNAFCRIDMNTLSQGHYSAAITGAPPGYVGSKENLSLFDEELIYGSSSRPGIVLFDEIEKADRSVIRALMNVLDNGMMKLASGQKTISFHNTLVFMTSNVGSRTADTLHWLDSLPGFSRAGIYRRALLRHFDTEFINRIGMIEYFSVLPQNELPNLVEHLEEDLNRRLLRHHIKVELTDSARKFISNCSDFRRFGARALERNFRDLVVTKIAEILNSPLSQTGFMTIHCSTKGDALKFELAKDSSAVAMPNGLASTGENPI